MRPVARVASFLAAWALGSACHANSLPPGSIEALIASEPEIVTEVLEALDDAPRFDPVHARAKAGDPAGAALLLLDLIARSRDGHWLRDDPFVHDPGGYSERIVEQAEEVLGDRFTFQGVSGAAARRTDGRIDWAQLGPRNDREWGFFLNRHFMLLPLLRAHRIAPDPRYVEKVDALLEDWLISNPMPARDDETVQWRVMEAGTRMLQSFPHAFYGLIDEPGLQPATRLRLLASVPEHADYLMRHHRVHHNHAIKEMAGLAHTAAAFPIFADADRWFDYATRTLEDEITWQVYPDGAHKELSGHYHRNVLAYLRDVIAMAQASEREVPGSFLDKAARMTDYLAGVMTPGGRHPHNNNSDWDDVRPLIEDLARRLGREDWRYIASGGGDGIRPSGDPWRFYPDAGHAVLRDGWAANARWLYVDVGPWGTAHQHNDRLHLSLAAHGRELLVDTGRYVYRRDDPWVAYFRSSLGHNVVLVDGKGQKPQPRERSAPLTQAFFAVPGLAAVRGEFGEGYLDLDGAAVHRRAVVLLDGGRALVIDDFDTDRPRELTTLWHFGPELSVLIDGVSSRSHDQGRGHLRITPLFDGARGRIARAEGLPTPQGWWSREYNHKVPIDTAVYQHRIEGPSTLVWMIETATEPLGDQPLPAVEVTALADGAVAVAIGDTRLALRLRGVRPLSLDAEHRFDAWLAARLGRRLLVADGLIRDAEGRELARHPEP
jgi:hypothetical protein